MPRIWVGLLHWADPAPWCNGQHARFSFWKREFDSRRGYLPSTGSCPSGCCAPQPTRYRELKVDVPGPGQLALAGKGLKGAAANLSAAGETSLPIKPKGKLRRKLKDKGKAKVTAEVTFTPDGGEPGTQAKKVKLVKKG